jgi:hypothetical protein
MCLAPENQVALSDSRRVRLLEIHNTLQQAEGLSYGRIGELVREAMMLIEQEELDPQLVEYNEVFARAFMEKNDFETARKYATMAEDLWIYYGGEEHDNVEGIRELWQAIEEAEEAEDEG